MSCLRMLLSVDECSRLSLLCSLGMQDLSRHRFVQDQAVVETRAVNDLSRTRKGEGSSSQQKWKQFHDLLLLLLNSASRIVETTFRKSPAETPSSCLKAPRAPLARIAQLDVLLTSGACLP